MDDNVYVYIFGKIYTTLLGDSCISQSKNHWVSSCSLSLSLSLYIYCYFTDSSHHICYVLLSCPDDSLDILVFLVSGHVINKYVNESKFIICHISRIGSLRYFTDSNNFKKTVSTRYWLLKVFSANTNSNKIRIQLL